MAIIKDVTVKINNGTATLDAPVQFYEKDHDVELRFRLMDYKYKYDKDPQNILNSVDEDILEAYTTIVNPRGYELEQINGVVKNDIVIFRLDPTYTDELDELGTYKLQIHIKCTHSEFTIPPITFEVLQRLKGIKVVTDGEDEVDNSEILDNSSKFVSDETGKLIIEWKKGDMISSAKLNAMVDVINDAVDEEKIRQENEIEREKKANNKIQELENTRVEYVNKFDDELDSFADQVDTTMSDYETRFNALTVSQQQDAEVIDARDGEQTLRARLDRDIQKPSIMYEEVEGSHINVDTTCGYAQNVEILGNTIQNQNDLADIRSVGDKLENQELYEIPVLCTGKNIWDKGDIEAINTLWNVTRFDFDFKDNVQYTISGKHKCDISEAKPRIALVYKDGTIESAKDASITETNFTVTSDISKQISHIKISYGTAAKNCVYYVKDIQLEEGTQATPYEPYQEQQITILSPVQLEKIGDVADRIICKDGVWGVEKNIVTKQVHEFSKINKGVTNSETQLISYHILDFNAKNTNSISDLITNAQNAITKYVDGTECVIRFDTSFDTVDKVRDWCKSYGIFVKYAYKTPQFIPLPHDQQIKLRTFANKTNIHFGCEIEPTLKASVPKSLGATVNSHTEQIGNLSKELDRVKKLEETVASEVVTESDFTNVKNTSNGYFEDVKLEGKTLVNLVDVSDWLTEETTITSTDKTITKSINIASRISKTIKVGDKLTLITKLSFSRVSGSGQCYIQLNYVNTDNTDKMLFSSIEFDNSSHLITIPEDFESFAQLFVGVYPNTSAKFKNNGVVLLEGDHTDKDISYFKGLKSVGDDVDEISVLTKNNEETKEDKKRILYYNDETQTWEKPALREWDTIEKHADGKYYYHKRSGEVVLNGSEEWALDSTQENTCRYRVRNDNIKNNAKLIADRFMFRGNLAHGDYEYIFMNDSLNLYININKYKLSTQDVAGFKAWLQANNVTVVYQLAEEKVYECTDLDLITYQNETNLMVKGGAIVPKTTLKVHQNIANIATILQEKVSVLENNVGHVNGEIDNINTDITSLTESIEGSCISVDSKDGYLKDIEILGNTVQDQDNLADIRSVGDKLENQELYEIPVLSCGKNLIDIPKYYKKQMNWKPNNYSTLIACVKLNPNTDYTFTSKYSKSDNVVGHGGIGAYLFTSIPQEEDKWFLTQTDKKIIFSTEQPNITIKNSFNTENYKYLAVYLGIATNSSHNHTAILENTQLEEGTVVTPYEPYQGNKLTILSPTPLEKVGDVADRIICKDGVWGVEKNIGTIVLDGAMIQTSDVYNGFNLHALTLNDMSTTLSDAKINLISDVGNVISYNNRFVDMKERNIYATPSSKKIYFITTKEVSIFNAELKDKNIKYILGTPTFIPLPHDQQIKLRTFANKTNISFGCEIEPTLKASVPKSISATVSTHTEQIDNLGREIDKIKKLEESTVSTVTTESDFTTVENTSNGYFEDVKIKGRTLVNLCGDCIERNNAGINLTDNIVTFSGTSGAHWIRYDTSLLKPNTTYTLIMLGIDVQSRIGCDLYPDNFPELGFVSSDRPINVYRFTTPNNLNTLRGIRYYVPNGVTASTKLYSPIILEGDHTQNPPEYFEGLKSVGQDADEISVLSCNENLFDVKSVIEKYPSVLTPFGNGLSAINGVYNLTYLIPDVNKQYTISWHGELVTQSDSNAYIGFAFAYTDGTSEFVIGLGDKNISSTKGKTIKEFKITYSKTCTMNLTNISLVQGDTPKPYQPHKQDKKRILYYNDETQKWEKPVLRQWDSIEKHSDGKYYYHKRSGEIVLNGSEDWADYGHSASNESSKCFYVSTPISRPLKGDYMCDRLSTGVYNADLNGINDITKVTNSLYFNTDPKYYNYAYIRVELSKLSSQDVADFKAWLQSNPTRVVYQLETEEVYECTSIDLITYENETNYMVTAGAIAPVSTLKVMCNITNVVRELQQKVSNLENYIQHVMIDALNNALNE